MKEKEFNQTNYINQYRKEHYKQLNVDVPIDMMEEFEQNLKKNKTSKKSFIISTIIEYNRKNYNENVKDKK